MRKLLYLGILVVLMFFSRNMLFAQSDKSCKVLLLAEIPEKYRFSLVSWSPDSQFIAAMYVELEDYSRLLSLTVHVLDSQTLELVTSLPQDIFETSEGSPLLWSPDSQSIAIVKGLINTVDIWNVTTGDVKRLTAFEEEQIQDVVWSSDSTQIAVTGLKPGIFVETRYVVSEIARIWNVETQELLTTIQGDLEQIYIAYYSGQWVIASRSVTDSMLRVTGLSDEKVYFEQSEAYIVDFTVVAETLMLASIMLNEMRFANELTVWNLTTEEQILTFLGQGNVAFSNFDEAGSVIAIRTDTLNWTLYHIENDTIFTAPYGLPVISPNNRYLLLDISPGDSEGDIKLIDTQTDKLIPASPSGIIFAGRRVWSPDSTRFLTLNSTGTLRLWSLEGCLNP